MFKNNNKDSFILKALKIHKGKYKYTEVQYCGSTTKVCILCPDHGPFYQTPANHLSGRGCPECAKERVTRKNKMSTPEFILYARAEHGYTYDYSKVDYQGAWTKVTIHCPEHGPFDQYPANHLQGSKCPTCANKTKGSRIKGSRSEKTFSTIRSKHEISHDE